MNLIRYAQISCFLQSGTLPRSYSSTKPNFVATANKYEVNEKDQLLRDGKIVVKESERDATFQLCHGETTHSGRDKTWLKVRERFYWYGGEKYVRDKVANCIVCANKHTAPWTAGLAPLKPLDVEPQPMMRVHLDLLGPLPASAIGNVYVGVAVCAMLKYPEAMGNILYIFKKDQTFFWSLPEEHFFIAELQWSKYVLKSYKLSLNTFSGTLIPIFFIYGLSILALIFCGKGFFLFLLISLRD